MHDLEWATLSAVGEFWVQRASPNDKDMFCGVKGCYLQEKFNSWQHPFLEYSEYEI